MVKVKQLESDLEMMGKDKEILSEKLAKSSEDNSQLQVELEKQGKELS